MSEKKQGFDHAVSVKDAKTGQLTGKRDDYKLDIKKNADGQAESVYERPIGSGQFFHPSGEKIVINGNSEIKVAIDKDGKTKEEFESDHAEIKGDKSAKKEK